MQRAELIKSAKRVVVKVGSAVLTGSGGLDEERVRHLAGQMARLAAGGRQVVLVSSGAISSGRAKAELKRPPRSIPEKQACAALGQSRLMQAYEQAFGEHGRTVAQVLLTAEDLSSRGRFLNARNTLMTLLAWGVIPVINENDTVAVDEIMLGDNDNLAAQITSQLGAQLLIILTNVEGILDDDPRVNPKARRIPLVSQVDEKLLKLADAQPGAVGRGGILSKVQAAEKVSRCGAYTIVANGCGEGVLDRLAAGEDLGTWFTPHRELKSRKHWIAFSTAVEGAVVIDEGAVRPIVEMGKSLLAAGIRAVVGEFAAGAAVQVKGPGEVVLGIGLCNYGSGELARIKGLRSAQIEDILGYKDFDEVIHRDNLVVFGLEEEESLACLLESK